MAARLLVAGVVLMVSEVLVVAAAVASRQCEMHAGKAHDTDWKQCLQAPEPDLFRL